jgi:hypothetical protein
LCVKKTKRDGESVESTSKIRAYSVITIICVAIAAALLIAFNSLIDNQPNLDDIADTETISQTDFEGFVDSSHICVLDDNSESPIDDTSDSTTQQDMGGVDESEQIPQEVQYEQNNTADEIIASLIQDTVTIRHISEIGLTYDISIPNLAADNEVRYIMLHHTVGLFETDGSLRGMHNDHRTRAALDGGGIAYSEIIQKDGTVWIARGTLRPSHTGVSEEICTHSYSITVSGNFDVAGAIMSEAQYNSLASRVATAMRKFPNATIVAHSDLAATSCPGRSYPWDRLEESIGAVRGASRGESEQQGQQ